MEKILFSVGAALLVFLLLFFLMPGLRDNGKTKDRKKKLIEQVSQYEKDRESQADSIAERNIEVLREYQLSSNPTLNALLGKIPGVFAFYARMLQAGLQGKAKFMLFMAIGIFVVSFIILSKILGPVAIFAALGLAYFVPNAYVKRKIRKRRDDFVNQFPDAIDMIVRSVRSGHPLNSALRMIAENMDHPMSTEFRQVVDEISYGRSLTEAMHRLGHRIAEQDLYFFIVVLGVQQETGGNLAEVLTNLSGVLRSRKQLRLKVKALTSEGRMTGYILGSLPFFLVAVLQVMSPEYLLPLWETSSGHMVIAGALGLIFCAFVVVKKMLDFEV